MEFGPTQITAILLALIFITLGLTGGRVNWRARRRSPSASPAAPPPEHHQFMRPGDHGASSKTSDTGTDEDA